MRRRVARCFPPTILPPPPDADGQIRRARTRRDHEFCAWCRSRVLKWAIRSQLAAKPQRRARPKVLSTTRRVLNTMSVERPIVLLLRSIAPPSRFQSCWRRSCRRSTRRSLMLRPHIQGSLSAAQDQITWVLTSYIVAAAIMTPLGGWLTDNYSWRSVFYINLPVGIIAFLGILLFIHETRHARRERFDFFGFGALAIAIGALQMLLDRGELKDWFHSSEIWVEVTVAGLALYLFVVHTISTSEPPFLNRDLLRDPNFVAGNVLLFFIGVIIFATLALQPTMLQQLMNYSVATAGLVTAPRCLGTRRALLLVGRIINRVDNRLLILGGGALTTSSLYPLNRFTPVMD